MLCMDVTVIRPGGGATRLCVYEQQRRRDVNTWRIGFGREIPMGRPDSGVPPGIAPGEGLHLVLPALQATYAWKGLEPVRMSWALGLKGGLTSIAHGIASTDGNGKVDMAKLTWRQQHEGRGGDRQGRSQSGRDRWLDRSCPGDQEHGSRGRLSGLSTEPRWAFAPVQFNLGLDGHTPPAEISRAPNPVPPFAATSGVQCVEMVVRVTVYGNPTHKRISRHALFRPSVLRQIVTPKKLGHIEPILLRELHDRSRFDTSLIKLDNCDIHCIRNTPSTFRRLRPIARQEEARRSVL
ncbi:hypothetical protein LA080_013983 [Diaporthe eres]|nr:hypothetical protein LA080_013983 [Diaporthe eres]